MKTKINGILTLLLALMVQMTFAQERTISGVVSDEMGPVADISVKVKGTTRGTVTDFDGNYSIKAKTGDTLEFTHVSYATVDKVVGSSSKINVTMKETGETLKEVVVTAMGIKREKKTLGYAVTTIKAEDIESKGETDIARILTGKIAGVQTQPAGGFLGSGTSVIIRSKTSITGDNRPLYIVDGAPISADRYQELDANNIANTSVLKGLAASTLYGEDGRNGVILITTKTGSKANVNKGFEIALTNTTSINYVGNLPDFQNKYGQGADQSINTTYYGTWGEAFNGQMVPHPLNIDFYADAFPEYQGKLVEYKAVPNNVEDFFSPGLGNNLSVNMSNTSDNSNINFSFGHTEQTGFLPQNKLNKLSLGLGGNIKFSNKFSLNSNFMYSRTKSKSPSRGMFDLLMYIPRNLDIHNLPYENPVDHSNVYYRVTQNNPLWTLKNAGKTSLNNGLYAKVALNYEFNDNITATYRLGYDTYFRNRIQYENKGGANDGKGYYQEIYNNKTILDNTFLLNFNYDELFKDITFHSTLGTTFKNDKSDFFGILSQDQIVYGVMTHKNFTEQSTVAYDPFADTVGPDGSTFEKNSIGVYGSMEFGYQNYAYLTLQARNDWASTVETENNSLFYPSVSFAFIPTAAFENLKGDSVNFLKLRVGFGTSANFPDPYKTRAILYSNPYSGIYDNDAIITNYLSQTQPNPNLKPERQEEFEVGIEGKFFNQNLDLDISAYTRTSENQVFATDLPATNGYTRKFINTGRIDTKGVELGYSINLFNKSDFKWIVSGNYTAYESTVIDIPTDQINIAYGVNYGVEGKPLGVFKGSYMARDENGNLLINPSNGKIITSNDLGLEDKIIGDPNPDWNTSLINTIRYKGFALSGQVEYTHGGDIYSVTASNLLRRGVTEDTIDREGSYIVPGVLADPDTGNVILDANGQAIQNTVQIGANDLYFINTMDVDENIVFDATTLRLRSLSLSYNFPEELIKQSPFGSINLSISGDNLWFYTPNMPEHLHVDPEVVSANVGNGVGLDLQNEPSYKMYSMSLKLTF